MTNRSVLAAALVIGTLWSSRMIAQRSERPAAGAKAKVEIVQTIGCVERRTGEPPTWWLMRAQAPTVTREGVFNRAQVEEATKAATSGPREFRLVGVADFLDAEGLLRSGNRAQFTKPDQVNATGELREGRTVLVKGLLINAGAESRINLLAVVGVADSCGR
jgi:hypothetical protein